jgi:hypothetical protein
MALNWLLNNNFLITPLGPNITIIPSVVYESRAIFSLNAAYELQGTFWVTKDGQQLLTNLGSASYQVRDKNGNLIGIGETGLLADSNGLYHTTPVNVLTTIQDLTHYTVELTIVADSQFRKNIVGITLGE